MSQRCITVNRKWINKQFKLASGRGDYFEGSTPREVAMNIVTKLEMHPAYIGKLDQLIAKLIGGKVYTIKDGRLVTTDDIEARRVELIRRCARRQAKRRGAVLTKQRQRVLQTEWHSEQLRTV